MHPMQKHSYNYYFLLIMKLLSIFIFITSILTINANFYKCSNDADAQEANNIIKKLENHLIEANYPNYFYYEHHPFKIEQFMMLESEIENDLNSTYIFCDTGPLRGENIIDCHWSTRLFGSGIRYEFIENNVLAHDARDGLWENVFFHRSISSGWRRVGMLQSDSKTFWRIEGCATANDENYRDILKYSRNEVSIVFLGIYSEEEQKNNPDKCSPNKDLCLNPERKGNHENALQFEVPVSGLFLSIKPDVNVADILDETKSGDIGKNELDDLWKLWLPILIYLIFVICATMFFVCRNFISTKTNRNKISTVF